MTWVFGYGSLIWRPGFEFVERRRATARGWARRFQQRSTDHRGTVDAPGRVATLVPAPGHACVGAAFRLVPGDEARVIALLDVREQQGYERIELAVAFDDGENVTALTYVAPASNAYFVIGESTEAIAAIVKVARGPSGANLEYARQLAAALAEMNASDPHVDEILALATTAADAPSE